MKIDLKGLDAPETEKWAVTNGLEAYRSRQIRQWIFKKFAVSFEEMTDLAKPLRATIKEKARINHLERVKTQVSKDGTEKYLFKLADGLHIESVLIPARDHLTLCISSQVGCAMGCLFCLTATQGLKRNLTSSEIIDQVIHVRRSLKNPEKLTNIVFMGMGEPLANYDEVMRATKNLISDDGMNFSHRKVTLSTCGLVPQIEKMGRDTTLNLAISLNAADDETRSMLMPVNKTYPLDELIAACRDFPLPNRRMITFEYILIAGINDRDRDALNLVKCLSGLRAKINLIPLNALSISDMHPPSPEKIIHFQEILLRNHFTAIIRKSRGQDILAACGQLSGAISREVSEGAERIR